MPPLRCFNQITLERHHLPRQPAGDGAIGGHQRIERQRLDQQILVIGAAAAGEHGLLASDTSDLGREAFGQADGSPHDLTAYDGAWKFDMTIGLDTSDGPLVIDVEDAVPAASGVEGGQDAIKRFPTMRDPVSPGRDDRRVGLGCADLRHQFIARAILARWQQRIDLLGDRRDAPSPAMSMLGSHKTRQVLDRMPGIVADQHAIARKGDLAPGAVKDAWGQASDASLVVAPISNPQTDDGDVVVVARDLAFHWRCPPIDAQAPGDDLGRIIVPVAVADDAQARQVADGGGEYIQRIGDLGYGQMSAPGVGGQ